MRAQAVLPRLHVYLHTCAGVQACRRPNQFRVAICRVQVVTNRSCVQRDLLPTLPLATKHLPPALVMCGDQDKLAFSQDAHELAAGFNAQAEIVQGSGHDAMLDSEWRHFANRLCAFGKGLPDVRESVVTAREAPPVGATYAA